MNRPTVRTALIVGAAVIVYVALAWAAWAAVAASLTVKYDLSPPAIELGAGVLDTITDTVSMLTNVPTQAFTGFLLVLFFTRKLR